MRVTGVAIQNYRNLDGASIVLDPSVNFIVGENNVGKSNFLALLDVVLNGRRFVEEDFADSTKPIEVSLSLDLDDLEIGAFGDLADPRNHNRINIVIEQVSAGDYPECRHKETGQPISRRAFRGTNYIQYDSARRTVEELNFDRNRGVGKFLNYLVRKYIHSNTEATSNIINRDRLETIVSSINTKLNLIKPFKAFAVNASLDEDSETVLTRLFLLADEEQRGIDASGNGVQCALTLVLKILGELVSLGSARLESSILTDGQDKKHLPLILALDEPEIHLHPYMQRSIMRYFRSIVENSDSGFRSLLAEFFSVDSIMGQMIVATHSPNILIGEPGNVVRFFRNDSGRVQVVSGTSLSIDEVSMKHFAKNMPYVKEAFFSKCIVLGEGDTEMGALPVMFQRVAGIHQDELGVSTIQPGGAGSVPRLMAVLRAFGINAVGILDRDYLPQCSQEPGLFFTTLKDFEEEVYDSFSVEDYVRFEEETTPASRSFFIGEARKVGVSLDARSPIYPQIAGLSPEVKEILKQTFKPGCLEYLRREKSILLGQELGQRVTHVPGCFERLILCAKELAEKC